MHKAVDEEDRGIKEKGGSSNVTKKDTQGII
jgi:hypothetical protein